MGKSNIITAAVSSIATIAIIALCGFNTIKTERDVVAYEPLSEWDILKLAIIKTECEFDTLAVGKSKDVGIFQITPVYVDEVNRLLGSDTFDHADAFSPVKSMDMFEVYQRYKNPNHDIERAISLHNPNGSAIGYQKKVKQNVAFIKNYERIRRIMYGTEN